MTQPPVSPPVPPLPFWHPASLLATWFGSGLLPKAPGTWGSLASLPCAIVIAALAGPWGLLAAVLAVTVAGLWAADVYAARSGESDPGEVVIDEVAGQWLALVPAALDHVGGARDLGQTAGDQAAGAGLRRGDLEARAPVGFEQVFGLRDHGTGKGHGSGHRSDTPKASAPA